jgi:hypothetical protein
MIMNNELSLKEKIIIANSMVTRLKKLNKLFEKYENKNKNENHRDNNIRRTKDI